MKIIFWAIIGYILYRWLLGNRLPEGRRGPGVFGRNSANDGPNAGSTGPKRPEGEIRVDKAPGPTNSRFTDKGEFVDYEEVD